MSARSLLTGWGPKPERVYPTIRGGLRQASTTLAPSLCQSGFCEELAIGRTALRQVLTKLVTESAIEVHGRSSYRVPDRS
ncbi:hypothetical protein GCM10017557_57950 [Streptomyces aurantiacus]|uniref:Uncharacterized protein n=1 Tax=Streptomyces aurantiacus TaxID=47760 RepID=A0A7G1PAQ6_9ACTN|nr:GntR family transcriptional regulator [Streptomyces aurantiacus]BCL30936.1 hypothetical protein GCM10017557_57950 [Streptomyces aurantiacus]